MLLNALSLKVYFLFDESNIKNMVYAPILKKTIKKSIRLKDDFSNSLLNGILQ